MAGRTFHARPSLVRRCAPILVCGAVALAIMLSILPGVSSVFAQAKQGEKGIFTPVPKTPEDPSPAEKPAEKTPEKRREKKPRREVDSSPAQPAAIDSSFGYFGKSLEGLSNHDIQVIAAAYLNRQILDNIPPQREFENFDQYLDKSGRQLSRKERDYLRAMYGNLTRWVALEAAFSAGQDVHADLVDLVNDQSAIDPELVDERRDRIIQPIREQGLFVPASILFQCNVLPYRPLSIPRDMRVLEVPVTPEFTDVEHKTIADIDLFEVPGPVCRVDFESAGATRILVERSLDAKAFEPIAESTEQRPGGVRGPVLMPQPVRARAMRVSAESPNETAVLRNIRLFALKEPAKTTCPFIEVEPAMDANFKDPGYTRQPQIDGFVNTQSGEFAEAPTQIRLCYTTSALFVGAYVREPRMSTRVFTQTARDSALLDEEALEIRIAPADGREYSFVVNPAGVQLDSSNGDIAWDGAWSVVTKDYATGWVAEVRIPFDTLNAAPPRGAAWQVQFVRSRRNVVTELSSWSYTAGSRAQSWGALMF